MSPNPRASSIRCTETRQVGTISGEDTGIHAEMDQRNKRRQDRRLLSPVDGRGTRENPGGLILEFAFEPEATRGVYELLHLRAHGAALLYGLRSADVLPVPLFMQIRRLMGSLARPRV